jgi:hypothetical protein
VDGGRSVDVHSLHLKRRNANRLGLVDPLDEAIDPPVIHQESDSAPVHPEDRLADSAIKHLVQDVQHIPVSAQRDEALGVCVVRKAIAFAEHCFRSHGDIAIRR